MNIVITGRFPTLNEYRNFNHWKHSQYKTAWSEDIGWQLKEQKIKKIPYPCKITAITRTKKKRDTCNCGVALKYFNDTLVHMELLPDDGPDYIVETSNRWEKATGEEHVEFIVDKV